MMQKEERFTPRETSEPPAGPWLVFSPHPDDGVVGMGGSLLIAADQGVDIFMVVMTHGPSIGESAPDEPNAPGEARARETILRTGVREVRFWGEKELGPGAAPDLTPRIHELVQELKPAAVFYPSPMEPHPDHRAAAALIWDALRARPDFSGEAFAYEISVQCPANRFIDITSAVDEKADIAASAGGRPAGKDLAEIIRAMNKARTLALAGGAAAAEAFYACRPAGKGDLAGLTIESLSPYWRMEKEKPLPLVTVIIRTMNRPEMLENALRSAATQTWPEIEALVVNDG
ncbi:MAG: hypothetical protein GY859_15015, partial [Desulfobacterales bacterium]|nr:hypothetical protein [Desulfobacterales bacterium]